MPAEKTRFRSASDPELLSYLKSLGVHRLSTTLPYPDPNQVNAYLIEGNGLTLIDPGFNSEETWDDLDRQLSRLGYSFPQIRRLYLTHGHLDHYGIARRIQDLSGANVFIHPGDYQKVLPVNEEKENRSRELYTDYVIKAGIPEDLATDLFQFSQAMKYHPLPLEQIEIIKEGETIEWGQVSLQVLHVPGHTGGMINFHDRQHRILFSGDHILPETSPIALPELEAETASPSFFAPGEASDTDDALPRFGSLIQHLSSTQRIFHLELDLILPGHGEPIVNHRQLIADLMKFYQDRQNIILEILGDEELSPFAITQKLFPNISIMEILLAVSEVIGNLEVLEEKGNVVRRMKNRKVFFRKK